MSRFIRSAVIRNKARKEALKREQIDRRDRREFDIMNAKLEMFKVRFERILNGEDLNTLENE